MGLFNFENELKKKLEESKKVMPIWFWAAAVLLPLLIVTSFVLKTGGEVENGLVKDGAKPVNEINATRVVSTTKEYIPVENVVVDSSLASNDEAKHKEEEVVVTKANVQHEKPTSVAGVVASAVGVKSQIEPKELVNGTEAMAITAVDSLENAKVVQVMDKLAQLNTKGAVITDATIDSLLYAAQKELAMEKRGLYTMEQFSETDLMAMELLSEVEQELDKSFKDKIFDALQDGYIKIKSAVATRNP